MDAIEVVDYDSDWPTQFAREAERLRSALRDERISSIEHVGSTAVTGVAGKPVIDILLELDQPADVDRVKTILVGLGYAAKPPGPDEDLIFCIKRGQDERRTHHLHVIQIGRDPDHRIIFRDFLRLQPACAQAYASLKRELAERFRDDRLAYMDGKKRFVSAALKKASAINIPVRSKTAADQSWIEADLEENWAGSLIVVHDQQFDAPNLPALIAGKREGLAVYDPVGSELIVLDVMVRGRGVGTALIEALSLVLLARGSQMLRTTTTNDNVDALRFYQSQGFRIAGIRTDTVAFSRRLKPSIPETGFGGIPIRDEIDLVRELN